MNEENPSPINPYAAPEANLPPIERLAAADDGHSVSMTELVAFAGKSEYPERWAKYRSGESSRGGFNVWAAVGGAQWFLFRKLYLYGVVMALLEYGVTYLVVILARASENGDVYWRPSRQLILGIVIWNLAIHSFAGIWANLIYYKQAIREITKVDQHNLDNDMHLKIVASAGGTNIVAFLFVPLVIKLLQALLAP